AREQTGDPREHARAVLDEDRQDVVVLEAAGPAVPLTVQGSGLAHARLPRDGSCDAGSTSWSLPIPAGTIGNTFSRASTRKSTTTGRSSIELALSIAGCTSSGLSTRMPTQPIAS